MVADKKKQFVQLLLQNETAIKSFISSLVRDYHTTQDVFQDVAMILMEKFELYDQNRSFAAWARGFAANIAMKRWSKLKRAPVPFSPETVEAISAAYDQIEAEPGYERDALQECMKKLPDKSRTLLTYRYERGLKLLEIAEAARSTLGAVHKSLSRIRAGLQDCIERRLASERRAQP